MKFQPWRCPACSQQAKGVLETIPGIALLSFEDDGDAQYAGGTDVCWDGQETVRDRQGRATLACPDGHQWLAVMDSAVASGNVPAPASRTCSYDLAIDGPLLRAQRKRLLEIASAFRQGETIRGTPDDEALVDGLINLTDEIVDRAADRHGIDCLIAPCNKQDDL